MLSDLFAWVAWLLDTLVVMLEDAGHHLSRAGL